MTRLTGDGVRRDAVHFVLIGDPSTPGFTNAPGHGLLDSALVGSLVASLKQALSGGF